MIMYVEFYIYILNISKTYMCIEDINIIIITISITIEQTI